MKKIWTLALALIAFGATAQIDRTKLPEPAPAKELKIGDYEKFTLKNGLTVILAENHKLPTLSWNLSFITGPITEGDKSGYASIFGQVMQAGTTTKTKDELNEEIDFMGAAVNAGATSMSAFSLSKYKDDVLSIMTDLLYNPTFPQEEFDRAIEQTLTGLKQSKDDPNTIASQLGGIVNYGKDHPYGEIVTEETVKNISIDDLKSHYAKYFKPNIAYLVIVGDITKKEAQKMAKKYFGDWKKGDVQKEEFVAPKPVEKTVISLVDRPSSVQSVISITYPIENKPGNPDILAVSLMNNILGGGGSARLFMNLREDKGYTYGAYSNIGSSRYSARFNASASVRNEVTDSSLVQFMYELERIGNEQVTQKELDAAKSALRGSFGRSLESRGTAAQFALSTEINKLPEDYYANYLKRLDAVTLDDIQRVAKKFVRPEKANVIIVGKAEEIAEKLKAFAEINYYDAEGNTVEDPTKKVVADISPQTILDKYIDAIGGKEAVDGVTSIVNKSTAKLAMGGQNFEITRAVYQEGPDKFADVQTIPGQGEVFQIYNSGSAFLVMGGQKQSPAGPFLDLMKYQGTLFGERFYEKIGFKLQYKGTSKINGSDAHRIEINLGSLSVNEYYDVSSGLKVRIELGPAGTVDLSDYRDVNGVKIAHGFAQSGGQLPVTLEFVSDEVVINSTIDASVFDK
ncbi:M16 family metallopeptidase [Roseivirga sp.]|uniref:M16 family metallopeptidase n=1 Tax=Roseivirga sp. TaxID=1964215 RepID=UPI003B8B4E2D